MLLCSLLITRLDTEQFFHQVFLISFRSIEIVMDAIYVSSMNFLAGDHRKSPFGRFC